MNWFERWFARRGWEAKEFQVEAWRHAAEGRSGLIQVATGAGKTYAAFGSALMDWLATPRTGLHTLYVTPLRAMTRDLEGALRSPVEEEGLALRVESRTGDTSASRRAKQREGMPEVLLITPESLSLLLSYPESRDWFGRLRFVIVDEWHELWSSKRGTQVELALARLRHWNPGLRTWALSATLANPVEAAQAVVGVGQPWVRVQGPLDRRLRLRTLVPADIRAMPWSGHFGLGMLPAVVAAIDPAEPAIIFANTRAQAELWFEGLRKARPEWAPVMAVHHGSLDREERDRVELGLKEGTLRLVVATSSLDLGVDFAPVEQIFQIGSPKSLARLLQRGGRAKHRPGVTESEIVCVPTHALQLVEFAAARAALDAGLVEPVRPPVAPLDVLCQHLVTVGLGGGFEAAELLAEVRTAAAYAGLSEAAFAWCLGQLETGGQALAAYPEHHRLTREGSVWRAPANQGRRHRGAIGTITADAMVQVRFANGQGLGQVEETFAARLRPKDAFLFAGRLLVAQGLHEKVLTVRPATGKASQVPHYMGGRLPLSSEFAQALRREFGKIARGEEGGPEEVALGPVLEVQRGLSRIPTEGECLVELTRTDEGYHAYFFPFEGRRVHEGLAALLAWRLSRLHPATFVVAMNDYGIEMLCETPYPFEAVLGDPEKRGWLLSSEGLLEDTLASVNVGELAKRQFRGIARVAGLVTEGTPWQRKSARALQVSAGILYDVFARYDPGNRLLRQAQEEVLRQQFEQERLEATLKRLAGERWLITHTPYPTPFSAPLVTDRNTVELSSETLKERVRRRQAEGPKPNGRRRGRKP